MVFDPVAGQYFQVGMVTGGVSHCGNTDIPDYYARLDHPEISGFISNPNGYASTGLNEQIFHPRDLSTIKGTKDKLLPNYKTIT